MAGNGPPLLTMRGKMLGAPTGICRTIRYAQGTAGFKPAAKFDSAPTPRRETYCHHVVQFAKFVARGNYHTFGYPLQGQATAVAQIDDVFRHYTQEFDGRAMRKHAGSFENQSQARMFCRSMTEVEAEHIVDAFAFELDKPASPALSQIGVSETIESRKIAILAADGADVVNDQSVQRSTDPLPA